MTVVADDRRPDLLLAPGAVWIGSLADDIRQHAESGTPVRIIIHDLIPRSHPKLFTPELTEQFVRALDTVLPVCDRVVTLSQQTADEIVAWYPVVADRIHVAVPTLDAHRWEAAPSTPIVPKPYVFTLSTVEPRKNHRLILDAWRIARADARIAGASLVIAGRRGWDVDELEDEISRDAETLRIRRIAHVTDDDVEALYAHCAATVHASLREGFGLPARESVVRGIPTLLSSAIPRDGLPDGAYEVFDPADAARLASLMVDAIVHPKPRTPHVGTGGTGWEPVLSALLD